MTFFQRLFKIIPTFDHVRVFGNQVFIFIAKDKQDKLQPKTKIGQLLRYDEEIKGHYCWVPKKRKIIIMRNVKFDGSTILHKD
jgi:hypothetical protein